MTTIQILERTAKAKHSVRRLTSEQKNSVLIAIADSLIAHTDDILAANALDMQAAEGVISDVMLDRLALTPARIAGMAEGVRQVAALPDPVGVVLEEIKRKDGLNIKKVSVPLGVVAIIYESRPNVTSDAAALALKSGNACVLRTGKEAHRTAGAIVDAMRSGMTGLVDTDAIGFIEDTSRNSATEMMKAKGLIDLLIPRGGAGLIKACVENAEVPCIETGTGICHVYVDKGADIEKALNIIENAKCSRPSVCNAMEVCVVHSSVARKFLPMLYDRLRKGESHPPVVFYLDETAWGVLGGREGYFMAEQGDFDREFLDYKLAVKVVGDIDEAIAHISAHSTGHSDCIVTEDGVAAETFVREIDSAAVYVNASTRFTDGGEFGLGCEMGISTQKLHARGPMGLRELTTYKYVVHGDGHVRN